VSNEVQWIVKHTTGETEFLNCFVVTRTLCREFLPKATLKAVFWCWQDHDGSIFNLMAWHIVAFVVFT